MTDKHNNPADTRTGDSTRRVTSEQLLGGAEQLVIEHQGADYRLRVTRQGKLILTK